MTRDNQTPSQHCETEKDHLEDYDMGDDHIIAGIAINWEDERLHCCHCNKWIECAYPST